VIVIPSLHRRLRRAVTVLAVAVVAVPLAACNSGRNSGAATTSTTSVTATTPGRIPPPNQGYTPFFLKNGQVSPGHRRPVDPKDPLGTALRSLIAGPDAVDQAAGLSTTLASDVVIDSISLSKGVVTIDFDRAFESANTRPQVGEVVYTMTQFYGVKAVSIMVDGTPNGAAGVGPQTRADLADMTPPVLPLAPAPADRLGHAFRCQGLTQLKIPVVCTVKAPNGHVIDSRRAPAPTTTSTTTTIVGVAGGTGPPSVEFDSLTTLVPNYHGPATVIVGPANAVYGVPVASVTVTFT
jgi:hypothetical protein